MINTGTSQTFLPAKFHNSTISGLFSIHKNKRVQFFMKHGVESWGYQMVYISRSCFRSARHNTGV